MLLNDWLELSAKSRKQIMRRVFNKNRNLHWYEDFERYTQADEFIHLLDAFIEVTIQYRKTHSNFGAKAVWEILRWHSKATDADPLFKLNNNYCSSVCQLVKLMFPSELDAFYETRAA